MKGGVGDSYRRRRRKEEYTEGGRGVHAERGSQKGGGKGKRKKVRTVVWAEKRLALKEIYEEVKATGRTKMMEKKWGGRKDAGAAVPKIF